MNTNEINKYKEQFKNFNKKALYGLNGIKANSNKVNLTEEQKHEKDLAVINLIRTVKMSQIFSDFLCKEHFGKELSNEEMNQMLLHGNFDKVSSSNKK